ncbi:MAG: long-chain fatty acid--CoA ligase [Bacillaceae bacterium G1]|nr:long-chain fatty acid--CoA ligase [Bacillota bacterium]OJF16663.1 MAG: long-chain fatty acid--CoA ligase [Bacillaceae bacterium G1]
MHLGKTLAINASRIPHHEALVCEGRRYTYRQLNEMVNRMAHGLLKCGIRKGDKISLVMTNSDYFVISYYAILKVGGVVVPINFRLTPPEIQYILDHSDSCMVIVDADLAPGVMEAARSVPAIRKVVVAGQPTVEGAEPWESLLDESTEEPDVPVDESDDCEILYTSGTTGRPKGALFDHHRILYVGINVIAGLGVNPRDRLLHVAPLFHSAQLNLFLVSGTFVGATHVVMRQFHPVDVMKTIQEEKITLFFGVPTMYSYLLQVPAGTYDLRSVQRCAYGAAPMAPELVKQSMALFRTDQFYNLCGLTEAGPGGVYLPPERHLEKLGAGGIPVPNTEVRVVDEQGNDVPPGVVGEMIIRGETVMKGYYKNPEATAETIRDGWLYTGDLAVLDEEGYLTLVDRKKDMIITGGENVYSTEVEQVLYAHPSVFEAAVIGLPHPVWGEMVAAVIVPKPGHGIQLNELEAFCRQSLAGYKIPRKIFIAEQLPRNAAGKVLKYQLRQMYKNAVLQDEIG